MKKIKFLVSCIITIATVFAVTGKQASAAEQGDVVINEIAWKTEYSSGHEWLELYNNTDVAIDLTDWVVETRDGDSFTLTGADLNNSTIAANGYYLMEYEKADETESSVNTSTADFQGVPYNFLSASGQDLTLKDSTGTIIDNVDCADGWYADNDSGLSMEKILPTADSNDERWWGTYDPLLVAPTETDAGGNDIYGTPRSQNSIYNTYSPPEIPSDILDISNTPFFPHEDHTPALARIAYRNPEDSTMYATVTIYDVKGREVKHILRYEELSSGEWEYYEWDGKDDYGDILPMGVYIVHMRLEPGDAGSVEEAQATVVLGRRF